jgi:hypothetical protein
MFYRRGDCPFNKGKERLAVTRQTDDRNLVWFGKIEKKLDKFLMTSFAYRSSSYLFYGRYPPPPFLGQEMVDIHPSLLNYTLP